MIIPVHDSDRLTGATVARSPEGIASTQINASLIGIEKGHAGKRARFPKPCVREDNSVSSAAKRQGSNHRERAVIELLRLVRRMAAKIRRKLPPNIELDDLVGAGHLGLVDALRRFDSKRHVKFRTYARHRIRGAILDGLRDMDHAPRGLRRQSKRVEQAHRNLESRLGRAVNESELAQELGMTIEEWRQTIRRLETIRVSSWPPADAGIRRSSVLETLIDSNANPFEQCYRSEIRQILRRASASLPKRQQLILALYYDHYRTMREISAELGIDESHVSRLHSEALGRLHKRVSRVLHRQAGGPQRGSG